MHFNYFSLELHHKPPKIGIIIAILQMRKRRLREVGTSPKCIQPIRGRGRISAQFCLAPEPVLLPTSFGAVRGTAREDVNEGK